MPETDPIRNRWLWLRPAVGLSAKLNLLLLGGMIVIFGLLGYMNIRLHRQHLEQATLTSAERVSDVIKRSTTEYMLRNDREGLHHAMQTYADEPGMVKVRVFDPEGRITYTTDSAEINQAVDKKAEACYGCHSQSQPLALLNRPDRFRIFRSASGTRVLGIITPIENQPSCSSAACHAHPAEQKVLGVLDINLSLARADLQLAESSRQMAAYTAVALFLIGCLTWFFVWRVVAAPLAALKRGTQQVAQGDWNYQILAPSQDEIGDLSRSFNGMINDLRSEHEQNLSWTKTLERRVEQKTAELKRAHEHALHTEKMASVGKMAAVLAHEINNPLSGILTYAKLLRKWVTREGDGRDRRREICDSLDLIASESRRCGDLVKNLLTLSRETPLNIQTTDLNRAAERAVQIIQHQLDLAGVQLETKLDPDLPLALCDASQIEEVLIALLVNAKEAMPQAGGNIWLTTCFDEAENKFRIVVRDDGPGISPELLPHIFDPFLTTKESGIGLGLAISRSILERHNGAIDVQSNPGAGTTFTITLPGDRGVQPAASSAQPAAIAAERS